jgi:hypothetical protein
MPQFVMPFNSRVQLDAFQALDEFIQGYVSAIFWTECNSDNPELEHITFGDLASETLITILADCYAFQAVAKELLERAYECGTYPPCRAGLDFWLTRNGHGTGFWDHGALEADSLGDRLSAHAKRMGECDVYAGDDGKVYLS